MFKVTPNPPETDSPETDSPETDPPDTDPVSPYETLDSKKLHAAAE
jgi:hypothetical protein